MYQLICLIQSINFCLWQLLMLVEITLVVTVIFTVSRNKKQRICLKFYVSNEISCAHQCWYAIFWTKTQQISFLKHRIR